MSVTDDNVEVKFLHQGGVQTFDWPMRNDLDTVFKRRVFYVPKELRSIFQALLKSPNWLSI